MDNICIIMMTFNRPKYIERSIESLYKRAGQEFDLYIFDDNSDKETFELLNQLKEKHNFTIFRNKETLGLYRNFCINLDKIKKDYDYYIKLDSDIEILSDYFLPNMLENFQYPEYVSCLVPRAQGIFNIDRNDYPINFYGGHSIKKNAPIVYGCCFIFRKEVFKTLNLPKNTQEKWGIDSVLYDYAKKHGNVLLVEDVDVYHIDNTFGQRRINGKYFLDRNRWNSADCSDIWFLEMSKLIYPKKIDRIAMIAIKQMSNNFEDFKNKCNEFVNKKLNLSTINKKPKIMKTVYKITSPLNFGKDENIEHGTFKYFSEIPAWAKNNTKVVVEKEQVIDDFQEIIEKENQILNEKEKASSTISDETDENKEGVQKEEKEKKEDNKDTSESVPTKKKRAGRPSNKINKSNNKINKNNDIRKTNIESKNTPAVS